MVQARQLGIDAAVHRRQRHELAQGLRPGQRQLRQPVGRQPVVQRESGGGEQTLHRRLSESARRAARPVRRPGLRRHVHRRAGAEERSSSPASSKPTAPRCATRCRQCRWTGATGPFKFRQVNDKDGKPAGYDAVQTAIVIDDQGQSIRHPKISRMLAQQLVNALSLGGVYALFALGFTLVFGVSGVINLAHGAIFMLGAYAALASRGASSSCRSGAGDCGAAMRGRPALPVGCSTA